MQYTVIIEPADDGTFSVYVPDLPGCVSTGRSREEAIESICEAIQGHVKTLRDLGGIRPTAKFAVPGGGGLIGQMQCVPATTDSVEA